MKNEINWVPLHGTIKITKGKLETIPTIIADGPYQGQHEAIIVKSDHWFESGSISFETTIKSQDSGVQVVLNHGKEIEVWVGLGAGGGYGIMTYRNNRYDILSSAGSHKLTNAKYFLEIKVIGSRISLYVNNVNVANAIANLTKCQPAIFFRGDQATIVENINISSVKPKAFIVMQFTPEFDELYNEVIKPTVESYKIECIRADDIYNNGSILDDITQSIIESSLIVADITPDNPNVFYEVGYSHAIKKPVILLSDNRRSKLPFDISGFRVIKYENSIGGKSKIEERLKKHINNILNG